MDAVVEKFRVANDAATDVIRELTQFSEPGHATRSLYCPPERRDVLRELAS
ncbi:MAG: hypothetical protein JWO18_1174 [Microbacteriaceae bacterium]|nr:hypothetical protein [Microbacteriaceae bacterium]